MKYKKGNTNDVANCLSQTPFMALIDVLDSCGNATSRWTRLYKSDPEFGSTCETLLEGKKVQNFNLQDALLCHPGHICVPSNERAKMVREAHYSRVAGHFRGKKIVVVL